MRIRRTREYEQGFKYAMGVIDDPGYIRYAQDFDDGVAMAEHVTRMVGSTKKVKALMDQAAELQTEQRELDAKIEDRAPPCGWCPFIGICRETELTCGKFRRYSGMGELINACVPDRIWDAECISLQ